MLESEELGAQRSFRNIDRVDVAEATAIGVADVIGAASLVLSEKALDVLEGSAGEPIREPKARPAQEPRREGR